MVKREVPQPKPLDPMDLMAPDHFASDNPNVRRTRVYKGHRLVCLNPSGFWQVLDLEGGKPVHKTLTGDFTSLDILCSFIDNAEKDEAKSK